VEPWAADPRRAQGELLWPAHVPERELARIEETMGSYRAAGQLQQRPAALEGELLKRRWWKFYDPNLLNDGQIGQLPRFRWIVQSWDTAFKDTTSSDYVVGQVWGLQGADRYLLRSFRQRANLQATKDAMREFHAWVERRWKGRPHTLLIEKSANGPEIISELKRELAGVMAITGETDGPPMKTGAAVADFLGGVHLCAGLLAAIRQRGSVPGAMEARRPETSADPPGMFSSVGACPAATGSHASASPRRPSARPNPGASTGNDRAAQISPANGPDPPTRQGRSSIRVADQRTLRVPEGRTSSTCAGASPHQACTSPPRSASAIHVPGRESFMASRAAVKRACRRTAIPPPCMERATSGSAANAAARRARSADTSESARAIASNLVRSAWSVANAASASLGKSGSALGAEAPRRVASVPSVVHPACSKSRGSSGL